MLGRMAARRPALDRVAAMPEVTINGTRLAWIAEHYAGFWRKVERGEWEPQTYREIDRHVGADTIVLDFGANIGAITLYAAWKAARVICFEPDPLSRANLIANIAINPAIAGKITVVAKAAHAVAGEVRTRLASRRRRLDVEHDPAGREDHLAGRDDHAAPDQRDAAAGSGSGVREDGHRGRRV